MKYLKTFENLLTPIYRKGDYVQVETYISQCLKPYVKILKRYKKQPKNDTPYYTYYVDLLFSNTEHWSYSKIENEHLIWINQLDINRKLTSKEVKELKFELAAKKFNI